ncbi:MAG TPA: LuxR C-terminal-related transcriptional regulator [Candidatus Limnocylindrales bacterium]|nr:LuxR C-terminal-related transcriptional regulator [Candidatus Limnocylindrales bacterium]
MTVATDLDLARAAFERRAWSDAVRHLGAADAAAGLGAEDVERLGVAQQMLGRPDLAIAAWERGHREAIDAGEISAAARFALLVALAFGERGDMAQAGGWHARGGELLERLDGDSVERGYYLVPVALRALAEGDPSRALELFEQIGALAERLGNAEGKAMSCLGRGQALIALGEIDRATSLLDQAMVAVTLGEVSPINVGRIYCGSIEAFQAVYDLGRAQEWTEALHDWCESQPDAVPFRGRCLVFRAELLQLHGRWQDAADEVERARDWLLRPPPEPAAGEAYYTHGELHRVRGELREAEADYREAATWGRRPDPGLALVRLAAGDPQGAAASIRRAVDEADGVERVRLLEPFVEIMIAAGDLEAAHGGVEELRSLAARRRATPMLEAVVAQADGLVRLAEGDAVGALPVLRRAWDRWRRLDAPYEAARLRVAIATACRALGDGAAATIELAAAREVFDRLGAVPDRDRVDALATARPVAPGGLSDRELEVLKHLVGGSTNRQIAADLGISERTVDRHVSNIYTKLDVSSRAAATAFALEHRLA